MDITSPVVDSPYNNAFEYGVVSTNSRTRLDAMITYDAEGVRRYRVGSVNELFENTRLLMNMIVHHKTFQAPRLQILEDYYLGNNTVILNGKRRKDSDKSDYRVRHGFASIISDFLTAYTVSNPIKIEDEQEGTENFFKVLAEFNQANDIDSFNTEISKDQNNMGRAYELLHQPEDDQTKIYQLDPREVFMIHDLTVRSRVIAACRYYPLDDYNNAAREPKYIVELYTRDMIYRSTPTKISDKGKIVWEGEPEPHQFGGVPVIEYRSDRFRMSVYERQIPQIDAYDAAQSDTANYMADFNDAMLAVYGRFANANNEKYIKELKDANIMILIPPADRLGQETGSIKAEYLVKHYDVAGVEAYKSRLKEDIFNFSSTPNLSDESFGGNQSGEALKYKLFGLQQKRNDKEKFFAKGLRVRYKLLENLKRAISEYTGPETKLKFQFTPNLPTAYLDELKKFTEAGGLISNETKIKLLSFVQDAEVETEKMNAELSERATAMKPSDEWEAAYDESIRKAAELRTGTGVAEP